MAKHKYIENPERLLQLFEDYTAWVETNPMYVYELHQKTGGVVKIPKPIPVSWIGFENYLYKNKIITQLTHYEQNVGGAYSEYLPIIARIKQFCYEHKLNGATAGVFNANIVARDLGLRDTNQTQQLDKDGKPTDPVTHTITIKR